MSFSDKNFNSRVGVIFSGETGLLSNTFNTVASSLQELIKSREEISRDTGRDPIAKGKFVVKKIEKRKYFLFKLAFLMHFKF